MHATMKMKHTAPDLFPLQWWTYFLCFFLWMLRQLFFLVLRQKALFYFCVSLFEGKLIRSLVHATMRDAQIQKLKMFHVEAKHRPGRQVCSTPAKTGSNHGSFHCARRWPSEWIESPTISYRCVLCDWLFDKLPQYSSGISTHWSTHSDGTIKI